MRTKHYISLVVLSIVVIFGGLYLSIANPQPAQQQEGGVEEQAGGEGEELKDMLTLFLEDIQTETGAEFGKVKNEKIRWNIMRGGELDAIRVDGKSVKSTSITAAQQEAIFAYFVNHGFTENSYNMEGGTLIGSKGYEKGLQICALAIENPSTELEEGQESFMKISCAELEGDEHLITVEEFNKNKVYDAEVEVVGTISGLEDAEYPFFYLQGEDEQDVLEVWYDSMTEDDGSIWDAVDMSDYESGMEVVLTGFLQEEGLYKVQDEFWLTDIELNDEQIEEIGEDDNAALGNPASTYCVDYGGTWGEIVSDYGSTGYCILEDGLVCEEWGFYEDGECVPPEMNFDDMNTCTDQCQDYGYDDGTCLKTEDSIEGDYFVGSCTIENDRRCGVDGDCNCYCMNVNAE